MIKQYLTHLSTFIHNLKFDQIDAKTTHHAKVIFADCIAAMIGGQAEQEMLALTPRFAQNQSPNATIIGTTLQARDMDAAFLNGSSGTFLEMDEGNQFARGHPGMHVLPALLALAEQKKISGEAFITAFVIAYEVAARLGIATHLRHSMHPHGTWGVVGGVAGLTKLKKYDAETIKRGINIASSLSLATSRKTMLEGGTVRNVYTGVSNQMAHLALDLLDSGFDGEHDGLSSVFGHVVSEQFDPSAMINGLGETWEMDRNYFKLHACCRFNHAALDALMHIINIDGDQIDVNNISQIDVSTYNLAAELNDPKPRNSLAARFSIPFAMATTLINGTSDISSFSGDALIHPATLNLASCVRVNENPAMSAMLPDKRPAQVQITLSDGRRFSHEVETNRGDWQDPYSQEELQVKYLSLCERRWHSDHALEIYKDIMKIETASSLNGLMKKMRLASA